MNLSMRRFSSSLALCLVTGLAFAGCNSKKQQSGTQNPGTDASSATESGEIAVGQEPPVLNAEADLAALKGKVVLVDFWASWCAPCREELPELEALHKRLGEKGLHIIGVNIDEKKETMDSFLASMPLSFQVVHDEGEVIVERWAPPKMPSSYIIDKTGKVQMIQEGYEKGDLPAMVAKIEELLAQ